VVHTSYDFPVSQLNFSYQQEKLFPSISTCSENHVSKGSSVSSNTRIKWPQDLHEKFVESVNRRGGDVS
jgi:hypothetical protein